MERIQGRDALLVVDVQNDFCPGGALAVPDGDAVVPVINRIVRAFPVVVATQDWHPGGHISFASRHAGKNPFDVVEIRGVETVLWPDHCVQGTPGAALHPALDSAALRFVLRKGADRELDSYSAFVENDGRTTTGLAGLLRELGVERLFVTGLATDVCVRATCLDGRGAGFHVALFEDACRAVDRPPGSRARALEEMKGRGVRILHTDALQI